MVISLDICRDHFLSPPPVPDGCAVIQRHQGWRVLSDVMPEQASVDRPTNLVHGWSPRHPHHVWHLIRDRNGIITTVDKERGYQCLAELTKTAIC